MSDVGCKRSRESRPQTSLQAQLLSTTSPEVSFRNIYDLERSRFHNCSFPLPFSSSLPYKCLWALPRPARLSHSPATCCFHFPPPARLPLPNQQFTTRAPR